METVVRHREAGFHGAPVSRSAGAAVHSTFLPTTTEPSALRGGLPLSAGLGSDLRAGSGREREYYCHSSPSG
ncbi:unnamed protein product [Arctogadus glacialis]